MPRTSVLQAMIGLLIVLTLPLPARAEEQAVPWLESLAEAKRIAAQDRRLILVYLDPGWTRGATTGTSDSLSDLVLEQVAEQMLVVRLPATVDDPESEAVRGRYGLRHDASGAAVINADGACFHADVGYRADLVLRGVAESAAQARRYSDRQRSLSSRRDRKSRLALARLHARWYAFERVVCHFSMLDMFEPLVAEDLATYARALRVLGDDAEARCVLDRAIATGVDHPHRVYWRIERATLGISKARTAMLQHGLEDGETMRRGEQALRPLLRDLRAEGDSRGEAAVRAQLLSYLAGPAHQVQQHDWITTHDPRGPHALDSWVSLMYLAIAWDDIAAAKRHVDAAIAAQPDDERVVPWLRDGMLPSFEKILAREDDPEREPLLLAASVEPEDPGLGDDLWLRVVVTNRSTRELRDVSVTCHLAGPADFLTQHVGRFERFESKDAHELQFPLKRTGPDPIHLVVLLRRTSAGEDLIERGTHVRIDSAE